MDKKDLKIEGLIQRVADITAQYEGAIVDIRADYTMLAQELEQYREKYGALNDVEVEE